MAIKPRNADKLSLSEKNSVLKSFREYSIAAIQPTIIDPSVLYVDMTSFVYFNPNNTRKTPEQLKNLVLVTLTTLNASGEYNKFGGKFKYSKVQKIIDDAERSITSNITRIVCGKTLLLI